MTRAQIPDRQQIIRQYAELRRLFGDDRAADAAEFVVEFVSAHARQGTLDPTDAAMIVAWERLYRTAAGKSRGAPSGGS